MVESDTPGLYVVQVGTAKETGKTISEINAEPKRFAGPLAPFLMLPVSALPSLGCRHRSSPRFDVSLPDKRLYPTGPDKSQNLFSSLSRNLFLEWLEDDPKSFAFFGLPVIFEESRFIPVGQENLLSLHEWVLSNPARKPRIEGQDPIGSGLRDIRNDRSDFNRDRRIPFWF